VTRFYARVNLKNCLLFALLNAALLELVESNRPIGVAAYSILCKLASTCWKRARNRSILKRAVRRQSPVVERFRRATWLRSGASGCPLVTSGLTLEVLALSGSGQFPRAPPAALGTQSSKASHRIAVFENNDRLGHERTNDILLNSLDFPRRIFSWHSAGSPLRRQQAGARPREPSLVTAKI
jgi:hypothetical protein